MIASPLATVALPNDTLVSVAPKECRFGGSLAPRLYRLPRSIGGVGERGASFVMKL
jgi:hypothetical protein